MKKGSICAIIVIDAPDRQMIPEKIIDIDLRIAIAKSMLWLKYHVLFTPIVSDSYFFLKAIPHNSKRVDAPADFSSD